MRIHLRVRTIEIRKGCHEVGQDFDETRGLPLDTGRWQRCLANVQPRALCSSRFSVHRVARPLTGCASVCCVANDQRG